MNDDAPPPVTKIGPLTRVFIWLAGGDADTARRCPTRDLEVFRVLALIMIATAAYQTCVISLIGIRVFSPDGAFRPEIILIAALLATFILLIDSFTFMRAGWIAAGEKDLARAGLDLRGGWSNWIKAAVAVVVRLVLAIGLAELLAIFLALIIFSADINTLLTDRFLRSNAGSIGAVTRLVDDGIKRGEAGVAAQNARVVSLAGNVKPLRDSLGEISNNPAVQAGQAEVERAATAKARADDDVRSAEAQAAGELSGAKGPGYSGRPGRGPQRRAAEEQLASAKVRAATASAELEAARHRRATARSDVATSSETMRVRATTELPHLEAELATEDAKLSRAKAELAELVNSRGQAIRRGIESMPDHVPFESGLIAQIKSLEQIVGDDRKLQALLLLIGLVGFGFELAGVLAKLTTHVPTTFAALTVRDHYLDTLRIVDELAEEMDRREEARQARSSLPSSQDGGSDARLAPLPHSNDNPFGSTSFPGSTDSPAADKPEEPGKRPRGRPRKQLLN